MTTRKSLWFWATVLFALAALAASAILLVDYVRPSPVFCDASAGCAHVRRTVYARPFGIPLPVVGISGLLAIILAAHVPGARARQVQAVFAAIGGVAALFFIGVQARIHHFCPFCLVVDGAVVVLSALSLTRLMRHWDPPSGRVAPAVALGALGLSLAVPLAIGFSKKSIPEGIPEVIAEEMRATPRHQITVVDFVDFECPFCRVTHTELAPLLEERKGKVRVARKHVPLRMHPHALDAARAGCCAELLGKGDEVADALFTAPTDELTQEGCEKIAVQRGLDLDRFRACLRDPATEARIKKDAETFRAAHGHGLPTIWVNDAKLEGAQDRETLRATLDDAIRAL